MQPPAAGGNILPAGLLQAAACIHTLPPRFPSQVSTAPRLRADLNAVCGAQPPRRAASLTRFLLSQLLRLCDHVTRKSRPQARTCLTSQFMTGRTSFCLLKLQTDASKICYLRKKKKEKSRRCVQINVLLQKQDRSSRKTRFCP